MSLFLGFRTLLQTVSFMEMCKKLSLGLKLCSFDACQLFAWSSLKRRSFGADLAKIKHVSMHMCHLTEKTNRGV